MSSSRRPSSETGLVEFAVRFLDGTRMPADRGRDLHGRGARASRWRSPCSTTILREPPLYVNNINTHEGGTHLAGSRSGLTRTLKKYADASGATSKLKFEISGRLPRRAHRAISVKVAEPSSRARPRPSSATAR